MTNKIAIITGGSRGLGRNTAESLARRGVSSIITYRSGKTEAEAVVATIQKTGARAVALPLDVSKSSTFGDFVGTVKTTLQKAFGQERFHYLVNNAGTGLYKPFVETTEAELDELFDIHLKAPYLLTQKLLPLIEDGGRIVNLSSGLARFTMPGSSAYAVMKGGIEVLSRYLAKELGPRGIAVNTVAPGAIETDFNGGHIRDNDAINKAVASVTAMGRVGVPDDVGPAISALLMDENRWITGQRIEISGGQSL